MKASSRESAGSVAGTTLNCLPAPAFHVPPELSFGVRHRLYLARGCSPIVRPWYFLNRPRVARNAAGALNIPPRSFLVATGFVQLPFCNAENCSTCPPQPPRPMELRQKRGELRHMYSNDTHTCTHFVTRRFLRTWCICRLRMRLMTFVYRRGIIRL